MKTLLQKQFRRSMERKKKKGFSLAELMLVLLIMAIMVTLIVTQGGRVVDYVNEVITMGEARQFLTHAQMFFMQEITRPDFNPDTEDFDPLLVDSDDGGTVLYSRPEDGFLASLGARGIGGDNNYIRVEANEFGDVIDFIYESGSRRVRIFMNEEGELERDRDF